MRQAYSRPSVVLVVFTCICLQPKLLAQIALYSAQIYEQNEKLERTDCLRQILTGFKEEVAKEVTRQG